MSEVVAISPATSTLAPRPMNTPAGLISQICPFAIRSPRMLLTLPPVTRLSAIELLPGCTNCTVDPFGIENALQVMTAFVGDGVDSVAPPDTTLNPESPLVAGDDPAAAPLLPPASAATSAVVVSRRSRRLYRRASLMAADLPPAGYPTTLDRHASAQASAGRAFVARGKPHLSGLPGSHSGFVETPL